MKTVSSVIVVVASVFPLAMGMQAQGGNLQQSAGGPISRGPPPSASALPVGTRVAVQTPGRECMGIVADQSQVGTYYSFRSGSRKSDLFVKLDSGKYRWVSVSELKKATGASVTAAQGGLGSAAIGTGENNKENALMPEPLDESSLSTSPPEAGESTSSKAIFTPDSDWASSWFMHVVRVVVSVTIKPCILFFNNNTCLSEKDFSNNQSCSFNIFFGICCVLFLGVLLVLVIQLVCLWSCNAPGVPFTADAPFDIATFILLGLAWLVALLNFGGNVETLKKYNREYVGLETKDEESLKNLKKDLPRFGYFLNFMMGLVFKGVRFILLTANFSQTANAIGWFFFEEVAVIGATLIGVCVMAYCGLDFNPTTPEDARAHVFYLFVDGLWKCGCVVVAHILYLRFAWHHDTNDTNLVWDESGSGEGVNQVLKSARVSEDDRNHVGEKYKSAQIAEVNEVFSIPGEKYFMFGRALETETTCDCFYNTAQNTTSANSALSSWGPKNLFVLLLSAHIGLDVVQFVASQASGGLVGCMSRKTEHKREADYTVPMFSPGLNFSNALDDIYFEEIVFPNFEEDSPVVKALDMQYNKFRNEGRDLKGGLRKSMPWWRALLEFMFLLVVAGLFKKLLKPLLSNWSDKTNTATQKAWSSHVTILAQSE